MTAGGIELAPAGSSSRRHGAIGLTIFALVTALGLTWAKWDPYTHKVERLWTSRDWSGSAIFASAGQPSAAPSWHGALSFTEAYGKSVWIALAAALLIAASIDALVPRQGLVRVLSGRGRLGGAIVGGLLAVPCMMCTCCSAPVASTLRRRGSPTSSVLGYWLGNPVLNPAVLVFLALVGPWQWVVTRLVVGAVLVFGVTTLVARLADRPQSEPEVGISLRGAEPVDDLRTAPIRFVRTLARLGFVLVPEYAVVVLAVGAFRGWLFPFGSGAAHWGVLAVLVAAVAGTLVVIPTAGEIPVLQGLSVLGLGAGPLGALLITLPAISLPSMVMVGRSLSWRVTVAMAAGVAVTGLAGAALLAALS